LESAAKSNFRSGFELLAGEIRQSNSTSSATSDQVVLFDFAEVRSLLKQTLSMMESAQGELDSRQPRLFHPFDSPGGPEIVLRKSNKGKLNQMLPTGGRAQRGSQR
jgi:hypothetical protein